MPRDQMRNPAGRDDRQLQLGAMAGGVRGDGGVPDTDAGGAPRAPGGGGKAPRPARTGTARGGRPRLVGSGGPVQGNENRALILAVLVEQPGDFHHVMAKTFLGKTTVWRWITDLHGCGECHISSWKRAEGGGPFIPTYTAGAGVDAICHIKPFSQKQKQRRHQLKAKQDGRWEERAARERAKYWADRARTHRDPMIEALFGPAPARRTTLEAA